MASLELKHVNRPNVYEKLICTGTFLYQYVPQLKVIRVYDMPKPPPGQVSEDNLLSFLFGMKAAQAKARYNITYIPPPEGDKYYYYLDIRPKSDADKSDFTHARLVLVRYNFLPRQLWFEEPNGNEIQWDFPVLNTEAKLDSRDFSQPPLPKGWNFLRVPREAQPRVMRNNQ